MPKQRKNELLRCENYEWKVTIRNGVYQADGRSNSADLGRHSLRSRDREEALENLRQLDLLKAVEFGMAEPSRLEKSDDCPIVFAEGRAIYEEHCRRPVISGGPRESTRKRYRAVLNKFETYCESARVPYWNNINRSVLDGYASWLTKKGYKHRTLYLELSTIKQILNYLIDQKLLPTSSRFTYPLKKVCDSNTYCWRPEEVHAILELCNEKDFIWLYQILSGLISTGMRIGELAGLRWQDVELDSEMIHLKDESRQSNSLKQNIRTTKSGKSRHFPIHPDLLRVLESMERHSDGRVFHGPLGGKVKADTVRTFLIREVLTPLAERFPSPEGEVGFKDGRLHSFRHYFCSVCANEGIPERVLMDWVGHSDSSMVRRYYHLHDEESRRQMQRVSLTK